MAPCCARGPRMEGVLDREKTMFVTRVRDEDEEC